MMPKVCPICCHSIIIAGLAEPGEDCVGCESRNLLAPKLILSLCDVSGNWPRYYESPEYEVILIDEQTGTDVKTYWPNRRPYGVLSAPPCTMFANSGARWNNTPHRSEGNMKDAIETVKACYDISQLATQFWAMENPSGTIAKHCPYIGTYKLSFNPCMYAGFAPTPEEEAYTKATFIYGRFNANLVMRPWPPNKGSKMHVQSSRERKATGSITPLGFAKSFYLSNL